ncbi:MAG: hypothetical protein PHY75_05425 [Bacteroidales bacterium]|nr:hypothetical protein [Bacteroidales bacterium]
MPKYKVTVSYWEDYEEEVEAEDEDDAKDRVLDDISWNLSPVVDVELIEEESEEVVEGGIEEEIVYENQICFDELIDVRD